MNKQILVPRISAHRWQIDEHTIDRNTVLFPPIRQTISIRVRCHQKGVVFSVGGARPPDYLTGVVDSRGTARRTAEGAEVGHHAALPQEGVVFSVGGARPP